MADQEPNYEEDLQLEEAYAPQRRPWGRRILTALIAVAALGGFAMVVVYSYDRGRQAGSEKTAPVLAAKEEPTRMKPSEPGGMPVPDRDKTVFQQINPDEKKPPVERLLPPPEPVMNRADVPPPPNAVETAPPAPADARTAMAAPEPVKAAPPPPAPTEPPAPKPVLESKPAPAPEASVVASRPAASISGYTVQLGSFRSRDAGNRAWSRHSQANKDIFGSLKSSIVQAEIPNKGTWYRLRATPFKDQASARLMCARMKARKIGCFVVRP